MVRETAAVRQSCADLHSFGPFDTIVRFKGDFPLVREYVRCFSRDSGATKTATDGGTRDT